MTTVSGLEDIYINTLDNLPPESSMNDASYLRRDGTNDMEADLDLGGHNINNLDIATTNDQAVNLGQLNTSLSNYVDLTTNQTIGGTKLFYTAPALSGLVVIGRNGTNRLCVLRYADMTTNTTRWDIGQVADNTEDYVIEKDGNVPIVTIKYTSPALHMNNYKITGLGNAVNNDDALNLGQFNTNLSNYVTLNTNQTITSIKTIRPNQTLNYIDISRTSPASQFGFLRQSNNTTPIWDTGLYSLSTDFYYWYYHPTSNYMMTLTTAGRLGLGSVNPSEKLQIDNGSIIMNRTDNLPALINVSTNSASSALGSVISLTSIQSRASGVKYDSRTNTDKKYFIGRPYDGGANTESRLVVSYVNAAGQDPAVERTGAGVRAYTPLMIYDGDNSRIGINTIAPSVPLEITGNTKINSGTLDMTNNKIINVLDPTNNQDVATKLYVDNKANNYLPLGGGTMSGNINMNSNKVTNLGNGTLSGDAVNLGQLQTYLPLAGGTMTGNINMNSKDISGVQDITISDSAVFGVNPRISGAGNTLFLKTSNSLTNYLKLSTGASAFEYRDENDITAFYVDTLNNRVGVSNGHDFVTDTINTGNLVNLTIGNINKATTITGSTTTITNLKSGSNIDANNNRIVNLTDPISNQDGATKKYVDDNKNVCVTKTASFTYSDTDDIVSVYATSGVITCTIPSLSTLKAGKRFRILKTGAHSLDIKLNNFPTDIWAVNGGQTVTITGTPKLIDLQVDNLNGSGTYVLMAFNPTLL